MVEWHADRPHAIKKKTTAGKKAYVRDACLAMHRREIRDISCHPNGRSMPENVFMCHAAPCPCHKIRVDDHPTLAKFAMSTAASERRDLKSLNKRFQQVLAAVLEERERRERGEGRVSHAPRRSNCSKTILSSCACWR